MKRRRVVEDDDDDDNDDDYQEDQDNGGDYVPQDPETSFVDDNYEETELTNRANQIVTDAVRYVLAREASDNSIRRSHLGKFSGRNKIYTIDALIEAVNQQLQRVFGLQLVETGALTGQYIVNKKLSDAGDRILGELWQQEVSQSLEETVHLVAQDKKTQTPLTNPELIKTGVTALVMSLLVVSENNLQESELLNKLQSFGISGNLNDRNQALSMNYKELVAEMVRKQYLGKRVASVNARDNTNILETYTLGPRAMVEMPPDRMLALIKAIYGDKFAEVEDRAVKTIARAYE